jgi:hypothetical protein
MEDGQQQRALKRVKFSPQVAVAEFHAHLAKDTCVFHLVSCTSALELERQIAEGGNRFKCEFFNQVFGDAEEIHGYKGLTVDIWLAQHSFHCW